MSGRAYSLSAILQQRLGDVAFAVVNPWTLHTVFEILKIHPSGLSSIRLAQEVFLIRTLIFANKFELLRHSLRAGDDDPFDTADIEDSMDRDVVNKKGG